MDPIYNEIFTLRDDLHARQDAAFLGIDEPSPVVRPTLIVSGPSGLTPVEVGRVVPRRFQRLKKGRR